MTKENELYAENKKQRNKKCCSSKLLKMCYEA